MALDIDQLLADGSQAKVSLGLKGGGGTVAKWESWISEDLGVSVSTNYSALFEDTLDTAQEALNKVQLLASGTGLLEKARELGASFESARTPANLTYTWTSSERPSFTANLVFITTRDDPSNMAGQGNPQEKAVSLAALCLPGLPEGAGTGSLYQRPAGYQPDLLQSLVRSPAGTFTLSIGDWFEAPGLVLMSAEVSVSQQRMSNGWPLYAEVAATLEPYRMVSDAELASYFKINPVSIPSRRQ